MPGDGRNDTGFSALMRHSMAWPWNFTSLCVSIEIVAGGDADLLEDQIDVGDHLGHRMLDLNAGVHLDEIELAVLVQELDGADAEIFDLAHGVGDDLADLVAHLHVERGRGAFLPHFLMPPLQRAVALAEMDGVALAVAEHLDFDVARPFQIFLDIDRVVAEGGAGFGARCSQRRAGLVLASHHVHAAAAAAGGGLDDHRIADLARHLVGLRVGGEPAVGAGHDRNAELLGGALGRDLVAHQADMFGARPDEMQIVLAEDFGKARIFRQEAVARMHGVGAGDFAGREQRRDVEIAVLGRRRADADALVGEPHMHRRFIGGRMHRDGRDAELLAGA